MQSVKMNTLQIVMFLFVMMAGVVANQELNKNLNKNSELHKLIRRHIMKKGECPEGHIQLSLGCVAWDSYNDTKADDYIDITIELQDDNTKPYPRQAPGHRRHAGPHPRPRGSPGPTKRPRRTLATTPTSQSSNPSRPTMTSRNAPVPVSSSGTTSSPHTMMPTVLFMLCVSLLLRAV